MSNKNKEKFDLKYIIQIEIPKIVKNHIKNTKHKIYSFEGDYIMKNLYLMNDFLENNNNLLFKVIISEQLTYIVITDISLLFFLPYQNHLEKGKLFFVGEIKDINNNEIINPNDEKNLIVQIKWKDNSGCLLLFHKKKKCYSLMEVLNERIDIVRKCFDTFRQTNHEETLESILVFIQFKEKELNENEFKNEEEKKSEKENLIRELIILYQKAIEFLSNESDNRYTQYIEKLKKIMFLNQELNY